MYYTAKVQIEFETDKGHTKKKTETYLVKAETITDAETIINTKFEGVSFEFEVRSISESRIIDVYSA